MFLQEKKHSDWFGSLHYFDRFLWERRKPQASGMNTSKMNSVFQLGKSSIADTGVIRKVTAQRIRRQ